MQMTWTPGQRMRRSGCSFPTTCKSSKCAWVIARSRLGARNLRPRHQTTGQPARRYFQASLAGQVRPCAFSLPTHPNKEKPQGRNRSAPARPAGPDPASCCWLCVGKMADPVEERRPTLHGPISDSICQRGWFNDERSHTLCHLSLPSNSPASFAPSRNVTRRINTR